MLDKKRIDEAKSNVRGYLDEGLLAKKSFEKNIFEVLRNNAYESLETANFLSKNEKSPLWVIVSSYYSMFYMANAVLYKIGYKVGDKIAHKVTADAIIVFIKDKLKDSLIEDYEEAKEEALLLAKNKAEGIIENFDFERRKRSLIQYQTKEIEKFSKSKTSLNRAKEFIAEMEKLLL